MARTTVSAPMASTGTDVAGTSVKAASSTGSATAVSVATIVSGSKASKFTAFVAGSTDTASSGTMARTTISAFTASTGTDVVDCFAATVFSTGIAVAGASVGTASSIGDPAAASTAAAISASGTWEIMLAELAGEPPVRPRDTLITPGPAAPAPGSGACHNNTATTPAWISTATANAVAQRRPESLISACPARRSP